MLRNDRSLRLFALVSILMMIGLRISWFSYYTEGDIKVAIEQGVLDLSHLETLENELITLDGEWSFQPDEFVPVDSSLSLNSKLYVPGDWSKRFAVGGLDSTLGKGTYQLQILLPTETDYELALRVNELYSAASFYANGELVLEYNNLDHQRSDRGIIRGPVQVDLPQSEGQLQLVIHASNEQFPARGGLTGSVQFGDKNTIDKQTNIANTLQIVVSFTFFLHALYSLIVFMITKDSRRLNYLLFSIMLILFGLGILIDDEVVIDLPLSILEASRLMLFVFISTLFVMFKLCCSIFHISFRHPGVPRYLYVGACLLTLLFPFAIFHFWVAATMGIFAVVITYMISQSLKSIYNGNEHGYFLLLFTIAYLSNAFWGALIKLNLVQMPFYPVDYLFSMLFIMLLFFKQHAETVEENQQKTKTIMENERKKDEFLATTAHELRNPLHGMIVIMESILSTSRNHLTPKVCKELMLTLEVAYNMRYTLNDLQDITRLKDHEITLHVQNVNLYSIANNIVDVFQLYAKGKDLVIVNEIDEQFPLIKGDEQRLFQVMFNLVNNAVKYTSVGSVRLQAVQKNGQAQVFIVDTGLGIPPEDLYSITHPYERGSNLSASQARGVGLGLSIAKQLVSLHGGKFQIESTVGEGTTISFSLGLATDQESSPIPNRLNMAKESLDSSLEQEMAIDIKHPQAKIIVIDDDPINLTAIEIALSNDYDLTMLKNPETLFEMKQLYDYSLIISDIMMPQMSGYELTKKLRERYSITDLPILLLTALNHPSNISAGFIAGANDYISKPVERQELRSRVSTLVHLKHAIQRKVAAEAAWLQAQIKPHFLFNTLNSIASLGMSNTEQMIDLIHEFGSYLRGSFDVSGTDQLVTFAHELNTVKSYLYIQSLRFPEQFEVQWDIRTDEEVLIPPFVLQTLVENALVHGALSTPAQHGVIEITVKNIAQEVLVSIQDNGPGIDPDILDTIFDAVDIGQGIGLNNTNQRLKMINQTGLHIAPVQPHGTLVSFRLPKS